MVKILHVFGTTNLGGAESRIMDLYRHIDREQVQFDFLVHMDPSKYAKAMVDGLNPEAYREAGFFDEEIRSLGGNVYALPRFVGTNISTYKKAAKRFFDEHHDYNVVQGHMTSTASIYLPIAKKCGCRCVIAHTRNAGVDTGIKGLVTKVLRKSLPKKADFLFACSHLAGDETFGGAKYTYIPNTIDTEKFLFNKQDRIDIRAQFGIPADAIVIGNVARFDTQKNQKYLILALCDLIKRINYWNDIEEIGQDNSNIYLIFCGSGPNIIECEELASSLRVSDKVIFAGRQSEIQRFYSAMDIFAFPSIYEGLPGVVVEAQAAGLTCVISDTITTDVMLTEACEQLSISRPAYYWADKLYAIIADPKQSFGMEEDNRTKYSAQVREAGFDVNDQAKIMMKFYLNPCEANLPRY